MALGIRSATARGAWRSREESEMNCDQLRTDLTKAERANDLAEMALASAEAALSSAEWNLAAALASEVACGLTIETVVGFAVCEAAAIAWAEGSADAIESAELAIQVAQAAVDDTQGEEEKVRGKYCKCLDAE